MKYLLFLLLMLFASTSYGQKKQSVDSQLFIKFQGGYLIDKHPNRNYAGFGLYNIGVDLWKNNKLNGLAIKAIFYDTKKGKRVDELGNVLKIWIRTKSSVELEAHSSFALLGNINHGLFAGPLASIGVIKNEFIYTTSAEFPFEQTCFCLGAGLQVGYQVQLTQQLFLVFSTRLTLLDFGYNRNKIKDPNFTIRQQKSTIFDFDFFRNEFPFMLGLSIPLSK